MLIHLTMTSVAISALGYQIINDMGTHDSLRFIMHLGGWLLLLFFTCFYGQKLIDKASYNSNKPISKFHNLKYFFRVLLLESMLMTVCGTLVLFQSKRI